jgi:hypothetical protein
MIEQLAERYKHLALRAKIAKRQLDKAKGKRKPSNLDFIMGDTWAAASNDDWLAVRLEREFAKVAAQQEWDSLTLDEQKRRTLLQRGWRPMPN